MITLQDGSPTPSVVTEKGGYFIDLIIFQFIMKRLQNDELVRLMGGTAMFNNESNYTLAGITVTPDPTKMEESLWDSDPCEDDVEW